MELLYSAYPPPLLHCRSHRQPLAQMISRSAPPQLEDEVDQLLLQALGQQRVVGGDIHLFAPWQHSSLKPLRHSQVVEVSGGPSSLARVLGTYWSIRSPTL